MQALEIGFIGLGVMGAPMAAHLARAGHRLTLHDADPAVARALAQTLGGAARAVDTPAVLAPRCDIVITMLPNGRVVQQVVLGEHGLLQGLKPGALLLDTSSSEPWLTRTSAWRWSWGAIRSCRCRFWPWGSNCGVPLRWRPRPVRASASWRAGSSSRPGSPSLQVRILPRGADVAR